MAAPLRVLFLNEDIGGHHTVHRNLERLLTGRPDVDARFVPIPGPTLGARLAALPVPGLARIDADLQPLRWQLLAAGRGRRALGRALAGWSPDVVHAYTQNSALLSVGHLRRRPSVVTTDATNALNAFRLPYRYPGPGTSLTVAATRPFESRVYRAATVVVASSEWAAASVRGYDVDPGKVRVLPLGVAVPGTAPPRRPGRPRILYVGRSMERKGGHRLIEMHQRSLREVCDLVVVTPEPAPAPAGVTVIGDIRPGDGRLDELYATSSALAFPSTMDASPNAVMEAMARALPVVAFASGGVPEMVSDGVTGHLVAAGDDRAFEQALRSLVTDRSRAATMGDAAYRLARARFDLAANAERLLAILGEARASFAPPAPR